MSRRDLSIDSEDTRRLIDSQPIFLGIVHARDVASGDALMLEAKKHLKAKETVLMELAISLAANFGPGTVGLVLYPVE